MTEETCEYYHVERTDDRNHWLVQLICRQLDDIGVTYILSFKDHWCGMSPAATFIVFDEKQNRAWIEKNVIMNNNPRVGKEFVHDVTITSGNLIECDNWLLENFGLIEDEWTAGFDIDYNMYYFKDDTDAMAFKLKFS